MLSKRATYENYGGPEVLSIVNDEAPLPGDGEVRIVVHMAGVNPTDAKIRRGDLQDVFPVTFPATPGSDVAGVIDAVGTSVEWSVGDRVFGLATSGGYAQHAILADPVAVPAGVTMEQAAALPTPGEAAARAYRRLAMMPGETLLVHGAGGAIGSIVAQLAVRDGASVIGTVGPDDDDDALRCLGGRPVRYGDGWEQRVRNEAGGTRVDAVLDTSGHGVLVGSVALAGGPERVVTLADMSALQLGVGFSGLDPADRAESGALAKLAEMVESGELQVKLWRTYPLEMARHAHEDLEAGRNDGKILLSPMAP